MAKKQDEITIEDLINRLNDYIEDEKQINVIKKAYQYALKKHEGQFRKSGEAYIYHPLHVAEILISIYADYETIAAGLLHEILEEVSLEDVKNEFGSSITKLIQGVDKLSKINFSTENEYLIDYYKKIIVGMSEDVRVIIIKLADFLHNMRTLWALPIDRQKTKAKEALEIMSPIAHHLGIHKIKSELEDLSLRYLKPDVFYDIVEKLNTTKLERDKTVYNMQQELDELLNDHHIPHKLKGRSKSIYSIYNKLDKGRKFSDIYDLLALRILVNTEQECYLVLGLIHSKFRPIPKRFKDFIAMPKPNMYQSLHTTVFGLDSFLFEIQIRTYDMDEIAENGLASHWSYKENNGKSKKIINQTTTEQKLQFFKSIIDLSREKMSGEDFVTTMQDELNNNIYCYTPKGDVIELPKGSTPLDFAYKIHTKVGETTVGAIVNDNIVPLNYELQDSDIVRIHTNKNSTPSKEWINMVKSTTIRNKIKAFFTKNDRDIYIDRGKYNLEKELRKRKIVFAEFLKDENIQKICKELKIDNLEGIYLNIGNGKNTVGNVINIIYKEEKDAIKNIKVTEDNKDADIIVSGIDKIKVNLANCCNPVYGDEIIGYITKGNGISVHRMNCHNIMLFEDRRVEVLWNSNINKRYLTSLIFSIRDSKDRTLEFEKLISNMNIFIEEIKIINKQETTIYELSCYVSGLKQLDLLMQTIKKQDKVEQVERIMR